MFEAVSRDSIADQVARQIRRLILNDRIAPGSRLPAERDLAQEFGTNRNTLREAVRLLEEEGLVRVRQGGGMEVLDYRRAGGIHLLSHYLDDVEDPARRAAFVIEAVALRREAMALVARLAATEHSERDADDLKAAFATLSDAVASGRGVAAADIAFHRCLGLAAGRLVIAWLINTLADAFERLVRDGRLWVVEEGYLDNLRAVLDAVLARDPDRAADAVIRHFEAADQVLLQRIQSWATRDGREGSGGVGQTNQGGT